MGAVAAAATAGCYRRPRAAVICTPSIAAGRPPAEAAAEGRHSPLPPPALIQSITHTASITRILCDAHACVYSKANGHQHPEVNRPGASP